MRESGEGEWVREMRVTPNIRFSVFSCIQKRFLKEKESVGGYGRPNGEAKS